MELLVPVDAPTVNFLMPLEDQSHRLGRPTDPTFNRMERQYAHLGDVNLRYCAAPLARGRSTLEQASTCPRWLPLSTGVMRGRPGANARPPDLEPAGDAPARTAARHGRRLGAVLQSANLTPLLPAESPVEIRWWVEVAAGGDGCSGACEELTAWWEVSTKRPNTALLVGSLGFPMPFNQYFAFRSLEQVAESCSFLEAYVGMGAGYLQVTRTRGQGPVLLVAPARGARGAPAASFEAWRPLRGEDRLEPNYMYENTYELMVHSLAHARTDWQGAHQWNEPTAVALRSDEPLAIGVRFFLAHTVDDVEARLVEAGIPVAVPLPAPTVATDMASAALWVRTPPHLALKLDDKRRVPRTAMQPEGCISLEVVPTPPAAAVLGWSRLSMVAREAVGRCRVLLSYMPKAASSSAAAGANASLVDQSVHLHVVRPASELIRSFAQVATTVAWRGPDAEDPWHRFPAFFGTDLKLRAAVMEQSKVFMSGLSDEAGLSMPMAMAAKQLGMPDAAEVHMLELMVHDTLVSPANATASERNRYLQSGVDFAVRRSLLYWSDDINGRADVMRHAPKLYAECHRCWPKCWWLICWSEAESLKAWRAYNYPHVAVVYWVLYRLARRVDPPLATRASADWYLDMAVNTALAMYKHGGGVRGLAQWGLMAGSVFIKVLLDVESEQRRATNPRAMAHWAAKGNDLRETMALRVQKWRSQKFAFGSEFPWDDTGHEEIYGWLNYFGFDADAVATAQAILAFTTLTPHWGFSGSARRYWCDCLEATARWPMFTSIWPRVIPPAQGLWHQRRDQPGQ